MSTPFIKHSRLNIKNCSHRAFTLLEILIVLAIIGLLAALIFPVLGRAREAGRRSACISNLRQIGLAFQLYEQDHRKRLPSRLSGIYPAYLNDARLFLCPSDRTRGQFAGNERFETNSFMASGVSYEYIPNWLRAQDLGWYRSAPNYGRGKWDDLTPLAACPWHWAKFFDPNLGGNTTTARGWQLYLTRGGSVRKVRVEDPIENFSPEKYQ